MTRHPSTSGPAALAFPAAFLGIALAFPALAGAQTSTTIVSTPAGAAQSQAPTPSTTAPAAKTTAPAQVVTPASTPEQTILDALAGNPITAPYRFGVRYQNGRFVLLGRVGTKHVHDAAVRIALALGYPISDQLVIDTREAYRASALAASGSVAGAGPVSSSILAGPMAGQVGPMVGSPWGINSYVYPPPLFGRYDDPFFGLEPPVVSYPPWWGAIVNRPPLDPNVDYPVGPVGSVTPAQVAATAPAAASTVVVDTAPSLGQGQVVSATPTGSTVATSTDTVEMTINPRGQAVLRGTVPTLADRVAVGQRIAQTSGVSEVINLLNVRDPNAVTASATTTTEGTTVATPTPVRPSDVPPPPPEPAVLPAREPAPARSPTAPPTRRPTLQPDAVPPPAGEAAPAPRDAGPHPTAADGNDLSQRLARALGKRPALAGQPIKASVREGVASLSGRVPGAYEAMLAYRTAQQTPGVREVIDQLEFTLPSVDARNPLIERGRPEDIEPYLEAQVRRQVGDLAHVDRVIVHGGDGLEIRGTLVHPEDSPRVEAILRSMPLLRGFRLDPEFQPE